MPVNIVKKLIKRKAVIQMCICLSVLLLIFMNVRFFEYYFDNFFALVTGKYKTVTSAAHLAEYFNEGNQYVKIETNELYDSRVVARENGKPIANYIWTEFSDGIVIIKYPIEKYNRLDFNAENKIRGLINLNSNHLIDVNLVKFFSNLDIKNYDEVFVRYDRTIILDASLDYVSLKGNLIVVCFIAIFIFLIVTVIKNIIMILNYKLSKEYRALKLLGHETLENAENSIIHAYNKTQSNALFNDRKIFASKKYIILKSAVVFKKTSDLLHADGGYDRYYYVKFKFNDAKKPIEVKVQNANAMRTILFVLKAEISQPKKLENIVEISIKLRDLYRDVKIIAVGTGIIFFISILNFMDNFFDFKYYNLTVLIISILGIVIFVIRRKRSYKNSRDYWYLENFAYQNIDDAEEAIIYDYNLNYKEHILNTDEIYISNNFIILMNTAKFRERKKLRRVEECENNKTDPPRYYLRFHFNDDYVDYYTSYDNVRMIADIVREMLNLY